MLGLLEGSSKGGVGRLHRRKRDCRDVEGGREGPLREGGREGPLQELGQGPPQSRHVMDVMRQVTSTGGVPLPLEALGLQAGVWGRLEWWVSGLGGRGLDLEMLMRRFRY